MNKTVSLILLFLLFGCNQTTKIKGAIWSGSSDFMYITNESMEMFYASSISTKEILVILYKVTEWTSKNTENTCQPGG